MRGIYIHIPFCRQACRYCDFFFSVSLQYIDEYVDRLVEEITRRSRENGGTELDTLYLGGGTPSLLTEAHLDKIVSVISRFHSFREGPEWTIECNPDDLEPERLKYLNSIGFNRLSIGIQSFQDRDLEIMRRSHSARQAEDSVQLAASSGFRNITIDLIYGIPGQIPGAWEENIEKVLSLPVSHLSAYHLTFEPGTVFDHWRTKGRLIPVHEEESVKQYRKLREKLLPAGFDHYELSNFGLTGQLSEHNMIYWSGKSYQGFGPSAHSYDGKRRSWNPSSLKGYLEGIAGGEEIRETEHLTTDEQYHDYLITSLRTRWGTDPVHMELQYGKRYREHFENRAQPFFESGSLSFMDNRIAIHPDKWLITDHILRELFVD
jgi:oxygen-independent coproporphyrinogen-3 oxidase